MMHFRLVMFWVGLGFVSFVFLFFDFGYSIVCFGFVEQLFSHLDLCLELFLDLFWICF